MNSEELDIDRENRSLLNIVICNNVTVNAKLVQDNGYPFEEHTNIQTPDGYLLTLHRIPHGRNYSNITNREPVLLMHGLFGSAEHFLISGPAKGLGFLLAEKGYDVWMGNLRCTSHSRYHTTLNPDDKIFWNFSLTEFGIYDLPTKIDYILNTTGMPNLTYIAHSQGNMIMFIMCSELTQYNEKIKLFIALSPVAYLGHLPHPWLAELAKHQKELEVLTDLLGIHELIPGRALLNLVGPFFCSLPIINDICAIVFMSVAGSNVQQFNKTYISEIVKTSPEGTGTKQFYHLMQMANSGRFQKYDYGISKNLLLYNSTEPPIYKVNRTRIPVALFYSKTDWFLSVVDEIRVRDELPNVILNHEVKDENFTHVDFLWANDVVPLLYSKVFIIMEKYRNLS